MNDPFAGTDAWILLAIVYAGGRADHGADRAAIVRAADYIDHAIPTDEELEGALSRLRRAALVREDSGGFRASTFVLEAYARTTPPRRSAYQELKDMKRLLDAHQAEQGAA